VFGGSGSGKDGVVNAGDLWAEDLRATGESTGVRAAIVATKSGNADGAKGGRKANASSPGPGEEPPPQVPFGDKQGGEAPQRSYGAEREVWSEKMLAALHVGVKGNKWFSLMDKVYRLEVLELVPRLRECDPTPGLVAWMESRWNASAKRARSGCSPLKSN
jgi:hypothetical protein